MPHNFFKEVKIEYITKSKGSTEHKVCQVRTETVNQYLQNRTREKQQKQKEITSKQCPTLQAD